jgi:protein-S-isoprenylcysteine O-methyltransferase Ste14
LAIAIYLIAAPNVPVTPLSERFVPLALWPVRFGAALTFLGIAFAIWARIRLAGNWSSDVTLKRDHELMVAPLRNETKSLACRSAKRSANASSL